MKINTNKLVLVTAMIGVIGIAQAERTPLQEKVLADQAAIADMTAQERRAFRQNLYGNMNSVEKAAYRVATKEVAVLQGQITVKANKSSRRVPGTNITYDTGTSMGSVVGSNGFTQGNRFDSAFNPAAGASGAINPVEATGSITNVTWLMDAGGTLGTGATTGVAFITVISNLDGTPTQVTTFGFANVPTGTIVSASRTGSNQINYANGPFLAGIWQGNGGNGGADAASVNGQGFHGLEAASSGGSSASLGNLNMILRVTGNVLRADVPVELMNFNID